MRSHTEFCGPVHLFSPDLEFDAPVTGGPHRRVKARIAVRLWHGDVVAEPVRDTGPERVDLSQHPVAILNRFDDHAERKQVGHIAEGNRFPLKLPP